MCLPSPVFVQGEHEGSLFFYKYVPGSIRLEVFSGSYLNGTLLSFGPINDLAFTPSDNLAGSF